MQTTFSQVLDTKTPPLGLRFIDPVSLEAVSEGLAVSAWIPRPNGLAAGQADQVARTPGNGGVYHFGSLGAFDNLAPSPDNPSPVDPFDLAFIRSELGSRAPAGIIISMVDGRGRFLPLVFGLSAPARQPLTLPLFSSPTRSFSGGLGVIRGEVWNQDLALPAAWALVTATISGASFSTLADERGMFALSLPYAAIVPSLSRGGTAGTNGLKWPITVQVFSEPGQGQPLLVGYPPDLGSLLAQKPARIIDAPKKATTLNLSREISYGTALILRSVNQSQLMVKTR